MAPISAYGDLEAYFNRNLVKTNEYKDSLDKIHRGLKTYDDFAVLLVDLYLAGEKNLREVVASWLAADDAYFEDREWTREKLMNTLTYLENRPRT
ncbi:hypothetical protein [Kingella potus]|uniref:hypothetical protein n=1 Tax=Kingella potus TaxID=265175 RepID=UPI000E1C3C15|nr:hypothetical protein [Kingella potus]